MECIVLFSTLIFVILGILEWKIRFVSNHKIEVVFLVIMAIITSIIYLGKIWTGEYNLSFTNLMYAMAPFNNESVYYSGPLLSDPMDATLPYLYLIFQKFNISSWTSSVIFGSPIDSRYIMNPINYVYLLGLEYGQLLEFLVQYSLAFIGMYLFLRNNKYNMYASCAGGITFSFSSAMVIWGGWPHSTVMAYAPLLFWIVDRLIMIYKEEKNESKIKYYLIFSMIVYLMLIAGMPTYVAYYMYLGIIYTIFRLLVSFDIRRDYRFMLLFVIMIGIAIIFGALLAMPYLGELYSQVSEYSQTRSMYAFSTLSLEYMQGFIFPYSGGRRSVYSGLTFFFFFAIAPLYYREFKKKQKKNIIFWGIVFIILLLIIFTKSSGYIYQFIPFINTSLKYRCITLLNFVCAILVCITVQCISEYKNVKYTLCILLIPIAIYICEKEYIVSIEESKVMIYLGVIAIVIYCISIAKNPIYKNSMLIILMLLIIYDSASFANEYLPLVDSNVSVIPEAIESIEYLQDGTDDGERVAAIGTWTLFPASNIFYDLNVLVGHGFINTNADIKEYLTIIDTDSYITSTKTALLGIDNYELLSYASVKYIYEVKETSAFDSITQKLEEASATKNPIAFYGMTDLIQEFVATSDELSSIALLFSTNGVELSDNDILYISILDEEKNIIYQESLSLDEVTNNSFYNFTFDEPIEESENRIFYLELHSENQFELPLIIWVSDENIYDGDLDFTCNYTGDLILVPYYQSDDNMTITEMEEYSPRVFIATNYIETETLEEALQVMAEEYYTDTVIATSDVLSKYELDTEMLEGNEILSYLDENDKVTIELITTGENMLVLTDYYYDGWKAYVDGEEVEIEKVNYLFRGIYLEDEGEHTVEFVYAPQTLRISYMIMAFTLMLLIAIYLYRKKMDKVLDKVSVSKPRELKEIKNEANNTNTML